VTHDLEAIAALDELGQTQLERLEAFIEERHCEDGAALFHANDESTELLWLVEGRIRLLCDGRDQGVLERGAMVGSLSLTAVGSRACDARVEGAARLYALDRESYLRMRSDDPELALLLQEAIVRSLAGDLRGLLQGR